MKNATKLFYLSFILALASCGQSQSTSTMAGVSNNQESVHEDSTDITSDSYWKDSLTANEFSILRDHGTERAFTGEYWDFKGDGQFVCRACKLPLFLSSTKYKSGTGWPSFFDHIGEGVETQNDNSHGMSRNEIHCARCKGHLGHIFEDGPRPTGKRYCVNSASILHQKE